MRTIHLLTSTIEEASLSDKVSALLVDRIPLTRISWIASKRKLRKPSNA